VSEFDQRVQAAIDTIPAEARQQPCVCGAQEDRYCYSDECTGRLLGFRLAQWSSDQRAERDIVQGPPHDQDHPRCGHA
jgi:hypothetical protein